MLLTFQFRIKDATTAKNLRRMAGEVNRVWNYCGSIQNDSRRLNRRWPSGFDLINLTAGSSRMLGLHSDTIAAVCQRFAKNRDKARRRPKWRASRGPKRALGWVPFNAAFRSIKIDGDAVVFRRRRYRLWMTRDIPADIRCGSFSEDASGRWYLNLVCEVPEQLPAGNGEVGIDLGLKALAALSNGETIANPRHLSKSAKTLARAQRAGRKALARKINRKIANQRRHFLHIQSARIAKANGLICVGNVNSAALARTKMAKSVLDAGWAAFRSQLRYKAIRHGATFVEVDERYTTQTCSACGSRSGSPKGVKGLRVRDWVCGGCGVLHDRDTNSAINILVSGRNAGLQSTEISGQPAVEGVKTESIHFHQQ